MNIYSYHHMGKLKFNKFKTKMIYIIIKKIYIIYLISEKFLNI